MSSKTNRVTSTLIVICDTRAIRYGAVMKIIDKIRSVLPINTSCVNKYLNHVFFRSCLYRSFAYSTDNTSGVMSSIINVGVIMFGL